VASDCEMKNGHQHKSSGSNASGSTGLADDNTIAHEIPHVGHVEDLSIEALVFQLSYSARNQWCF